MPVERSNTVGLADLIPVDWETPTRQAYDRVDMDLLRELVQAHLPPLRPRASPRQYGQVLETVRWMIAFDIEGQFSRRRIWSQRRVADRMDLEFETVQAKIRRLYENRSGRESAQALFEADFKRIERHYNYRLKNR